MVSFHNACESVFMRPESLSVLLIEYDQSILCNKKQVPYQYLAAPNNWDSGGLIQMKTDRIHTHAHSLTITATIIFVNR